MTDLRNTASAVHGLSSHTQNTVNTTSKAALKAAPTVRSKPTVPPLDLRASKPVAQFVAPDITDVDEPRFQDVPVQREDPIREVAARTSAAPKVAPQSTPLSATQADGPATGSDVSEAATARDHSTLSAETAEPMEAQTTSHESAATAPVGAAAPSYRQAPAFDATLLGTPSPMSAHTNARASRETPVSASPTPHAQADVTDIYAATPYSGAAHHFEHSASLRASSQLQPGLVQYDGTVTPMMQPSPACAVNGLSGAAFAQSTPTHHAATPLPAASKPVHATAMAADDSANARANVTRKSRWSFESTQPAADTAQPKFSWSKPVKPKPMFSWTQAQADAEAKKPRFSWGGSVNTGSAKSSSTVRASNAAQAKRAQQARNAAAADVQPTEILQPVQAAQVAQPMQQTPAATPMVDANLAAAMVEFAPQSSEFEAQQYTPPQLVFTPVTDNPPIDNTPVVNASMGAQAAVGVGTAVAQAAVQPIMQTAQGMQQAGRTAAQTAQVAGAVSATGAQAGVAAGKAAAAGARAVKKTAQAAAGKPTAATATNATAAQQAAARKAAAQRAARAKAQQQATQQRHEHLKYMSPQQQSLLEQETQQRAMAVAAARKKAALRKQAQIKAQRAAQAQRLAQAQAQIAAQQASNAANGTSTAAAAPRAGQTTNAGQQVQQSQQPTPAQSAANAHQKAAQQPPAASQPAQNAQAQAAPVQADQQAQVMQQPTATPVAAAAQAVQSTAQAQVPADPNAQQQVAQATAPTATAMPGTSSPSFEEVVYSSRAGQLPHKPIPANTLQAKTKVPKNRKNAKANAANADASASDDPAAIGLGTNGSAFAAMNSEQLPPIAPMPQWMSNNPQPTAFADMTVGSEYAEPTLTEPWQGCSFSQSVIRFFKNYVRFGTRASRSEFWWAMLFNALIAGAFGMFALIHQIGLWLLLGWMAIILIPSFALSWRRLHDARLPGALALLPFFLALTAAGFLWFGYVGGHEVNGGGVLLVFTASGVVIGALALASTLWFFTRDSAPDPAESDEDTADPPPTEPGQTPTPSSSTNASSGFSSPATAPAFQPIPALQTA